MSLMFFELAATVLRIYLTDTKIPWGEHPPATEGHYTGLVGQRAMMTSEMKEERENGNDLGDDNGLYRRGAVKMVLTSIVPDKASV